jgi:GTP-sensing pleiotropic transcriptional regulator CodY
MQPQEPVVVSSVKLSKLGVNRYAKRRALRKLEEAGLIQVLRANGRNPRVKVVE